ncbi:MAG: PadR family transcriptional regulator [Acidobacteriia bacterium]|nr:PadR family transcriptional regulator [Terriglobia bacterium]
MQRSSSGPEILLGLLTVEPMSGYDLRQAILGSIGHFWNESYGQIYPNLKRLAAGGFVKSRTVHQPGKPDRHIHSITEKGRQRLRKWLAVPPQPEIPRNELLLKLFLGAQTSPDILIGYVDDMARQSRAILETLGRALAEGVEANPHHPAVPYWTMAARFGQLEMEAHLRWAEETLAALHSIAAKETGCVKGRKHGNR